MPGSPPGTAAAVTVSGTAIVVVSALVITTSCAPAGVPVGTFQVSDTAPSSSAMAAPMSTGSEWSAKDTRSPGVRPVASTVTVDPAWMVEVESAITGGATTSASTMNGAVMSRPAGPVTRTEPVPAAAEGALVWLPVTVKSEAASAPIASLPSITPADVCPSGQVIVALS